MKVNSTIGIVSAMLLMLNLSPTELTAEPVIANADEIVAWIEQQQLMGTPNGVILNTLATNDCFVASNVWKACFSFEFATNDILASIDEYGKKVNVAICLRPLCGIEVNQDLHEAYMHFCDIGASYSFGVQQPTNSLFLICEPARSILKGHFLRLINKGPFFRKPFER